MTFKQIMIVLGALLTTLGPVLVHLMSPTLLGEIGAVAAPLGAFLVQLLALFSPAPGSLAKDAAVKTAGPLGVFLVVGLLGRSLVGCASVPPAVVNAAPSGVEFAVCVISTYATDDAANLAPGVIIADIVSKCGGDAVKVTEILTAHQAAEAKEQAAQAARMRHHVR